MSEKEIMDKLKEYHQYLYELAYMVTPLDYATDGSARDLYLKCKEGIEILKK